MSRDSIGLLCALVLVGFRLGIAPASAQSLPAPSAALETQASESQARTFRADRGYRVASPNASSGTGLGGPFYTPIPANPALDPNSAPIIAGLLAQLGAPQFAPLRAAAPPYTGPGYNIDFNLPVFYSSIDTPQYTVHCAYNGIWGACPLESKLVRIPNAAYPEQSGGTFGTCAPHHVCACPSPQSCTDHHMTIVDSVLSIEYDLYQALPPSGGGGAYEIAFGSFFPVPTQGVGVSAADQSGYANTTGLIRAIDLLPDAATGVVAPIQHALRFIVPCANDYNAMYGNPALPFSAYPATNASSDMHCTRATAWEPYYGMRLQLNAAPSTIANWPIPEYEKAIFTALAVYGAYLSDTGSGAQGSGLLSLVAESGLTYTQMGLPNPWVTLASQQRPAIAARGQPPNSTYEFILTAGGILANLAPYLQVVAPDPCVTNIPWNCPF